MLIRDVDRSYAAPSRRSRADRDANPLRKTAEGLGTFLDRLSEAVQEPDADSVDSAARIHSRGGRNSRGFKFPSPQAEPAPVELNLTAEQAEAYGILKSARNLASDASSVAMSIQERAASQEKLKTLFNELSAKRIEILASVFDRNPADGERPLFSLHTPDSARTAYSGIDEIILKFLDVGTKNSAGESGGANSPYLDHREALNASELLREFLLSEGPAKAFARFREINRSNVLGLLQHG